MPRLIHGKTSSPWARCCSRCWPGLSRFLAQVPSRSWPRSVTAILSIPSGPIPGSRVPLPTSSFARSSETRPGVSSRPRSLPRHSKHSCNLPATPRLRRRRAIPRSRSTSPGSELLQKCSACGSSIIKSQTSLGGTCEVCHGPLCSRCWTVRGVRRCGHHPRHEPVHDEPFPGPAEAAGVEPAGTPMARPLSQEPARATAVVYPDLSQAEPIPAARVMREEPPSAQPLPDAADSEVKPTSGHTPAASSELFSIRKRVRGGDESSGATGRTVVKASDVGVMVETFLRRVSNALQTLQEVKDPVRGVVVPVRDWEKVARRIGGRAGIVSQPAGPQARASRAQVSNNLLVVYELAARNWLGQQAGRIKIEARSLVRSERLAANGSDDQSMERIDVEAVLNEAAVRAQREGNWHLEILCSPTGWSSDTCRFVCRTNAASFHDRLVSAILFDNDSGQVPHAS